MKTQRIALFAMTAALAALSATAATTTLRLDTRSGARPVAALEQIAYSSAWNDGAGGVVLTLDNAPLLTLGAPCSGVFAWDTADLDAGLHVLALDDGVERLTAEFSAEGDSFYTLAEALDAPNLAWTTGGAWGWRALPTNGVPTGGCARSGAVDSGQTSWIETRVPGAGTVAFRWRATCRSRNEMAVFEVDDESKARLTGVADWTGAVFEVEGESEHVLRWTFRRGSNAAVGDEGAWLDEVTWTPTPRTLAVSGALGGWPTNGVNEIPSGTEVSAWSAGSVVDGRVRHDCTGWRGTGSVPAQGTGTNAVFTLREDSTLAWQLTTNYLVRVSVVGDGTVDISEAWVPAGDSLLVTATAGTTAYTSALWSGDTDGATVDGLRITIPGDRPRDVAITFDVLGLGLAVEQEGRVWTTDGEAPWYAVTAGTHDGVDAVRTGAIPETGDLGESRLRATFTGPGSLSFWWKLASSPTTSGIDLYVDGQDVDVWLIDETGWEQRTVALGEGSHVVEWNFWSDGTAPDDAAWLDQVTWTPEGGGVNTATQTTPVHVPYAWLNGFCLGDGTEAGYEAAAKAMASNGVNRVWQCHVVGLDPTDETAAFRTTIRMENGEPIIATDPERPDWTPAAWYRIEGKTNLDDAWAPKASAHRFFRVRVVVPEE